MIGCLVVLAAVAVAGWFLYPKWRDYRANEPASTSAVVWEPLTAAAATQARTAIEKLGQPRGQVFANLRPGGVSSYVFEELSKGVLPPSAESIEAAVIGDQLFVRASVKLSDFGGKQTLGPIGAMLSDRERVQFGGTLEVIRPGLAQYRVKALQIRDFSIPPQLIPRLVRRIEEGKRPEGLAPEALPLVIPSYIGDVRIAKGKITLYKAVP
ncbi:MAG: hypothetical protein H7Z74_01960 [Anaerolineae bacterium]|nr:hypothetical protein [Gemmatimonadaceae bacterium]